MPQDKEADPGGSLSSKSLLGQETSLCVSLDIPENLSPHFRAVWSGKVVVGTAATLFLHFYRLRTSHKVPLRRARADGGKGGRGDFRNRPPRNVEANVPTWGVCVCGGLALSNGAGRGRVATEVRPGPKATRLALPSASGGTMVEGERAFGPKGSPGSGAPYQS